MKNSIKLVLGDCLEKIKKIPDNSVDLILTDPPYNIAKYSTGNIKFDWRQDINNDLAEWDLKDLNPLDLVKEYKRVLKSTGNIFIFTSYNMIGKFHEAFDDEFDTFQFMVWHKKNPVPNFFKKGFLNSCELIVACWNKGHKWNFKTQAEMHNFIESGICSGKERIKGIDGKTLHPTQKPLDILKHIIEISSNEGDLVLDPFMGVGSTGEACKILGRRFIGIEMDKIYFKASEKRLGVNELENLTFIEKINLIKKITNKSLLNLKLDISLQLV
ncbi:MAG: site-specific DNA-methyltransferase [Candidatus Gracilibacteria bacterium]|nr:site-specific DNA-methyltransferase [Candidatus Gracilibacteria bacterium]